MKHQKEFKEIFLKSHFHSSSDRKQENKSHRVRKHRAYTLRIKSLSWFGPKVTPIKR